MGNSDDKVVFDLYCGTGTIGQIVAPKAKKVIGIELIEEAVEMAKQCLGMCLETREMEGKEFPKATYGDLECEKNCFYMLIEFDLLEYKKKYNRKSIRKNVTIPAWLNELAEASNVNFSNVLQNALIKQLNLD